MGQDRETSDDMEVQEELEDSLGHLFLRSCPPQLFETRSFTGIWSLLVRQCWLVSDLRDPPVSASTVLGLQTCAMTSSFLQGRLVLCTDELISYTHNYQVKLFLISSLWVDFQNYVLYTEYDWIVGYTRRQSNLHTKSEQKQIKAGQKQLITKFIPLQLRHRPLPRA